jgi:hypothetical protein
MKLRRHELHAIAHDTVKYGCDWNPDVVKILATTKEGMFESKITKLLAATPTETTATVSASVEDYDSSEDSLNTSMPSLADDETEAETEAVIAAAAVSTSSTDESVDDAAAAGTSGKRLVSLLNIIC